MTSMSRVRERPRRGRAYFVGLSAALGLLALGLTIPWNAGAAEQGDEPRTIPNEKCLGCHDDPELANDAGESMAVLQDAFSASVHRRVDCVECHTDALTTRHPRNDLGPVSTESCKGCHDDFKK